MLYTYIIYIYIKTHLKENIRIRISKYKRHQVLN